MDQNISNRTITRQEDSLDESDISLGDQPPYFFWGRTSQQLAHFDFPVKEDFDRWAKHWSEQRFLLHHNCKYLKLNSVYKLVYILTLIFGLYGSNLFELCFDSRSQIPFDCLNGFCFLMYLLNIVLTLLGSIDYLNSFYFFVDIVSCTIIFFDFNWLLAIFFD